MAVLLATLVAGGCSASQRRYASIHSRAFDPVPTGGSGPGRTASGKPFTGWRTRELSLARLLQVAQRRNPTLAAMHASWQVAVEQYPQVSALADPQLGYAFAPGTIDSTSAGYGQRIDLSQRLPWPGKLDLRGEAALSDAEAAEDDFASARLRLIRAVTEAFFAYEFVFRATDINNANQRLLRQLQHVAEERYATGLASKSDALQANVERERLVHRAIALDRERTVARARLNTLLDLPPKDALPPPPRRIPEPAPLPPVALLERVALESHPVLRALEHSLDARQSEVELAQREYFPDFAVGAAYNSLWDDPDKRTLVAFNIEVPLQQDRRRAAVSQARAEHRRAESRLAEARASALLQLSETYDELAETSQVVHLYRSSIVPAARESFESARAGYEAAASDFLTLVSTEKALHAAELIYEHALAQYHQGLARLEYAVGRPLDALQEVP